MVPSGLAHPLASPEACHTQPLVSSPQPLTPPPLEQLPAHLPQLVQVADKMYGVSHTNRLSRIDTITRDDALTFLAT